MLPFLPLLIVIGPVCLGLQCRVAYTRSSVNVGHEADGSHAQRPNNKNECIDMTDVDSRSCYP